MSDALIEACQSDSLIEEVLTFMTKEYSGAVPADAVEAPALRYAVSVTIGRLRAAGISDLVIAKALVDEAATS